MVRLPRAVSHGGRHRRTYVGWIDRDGDLVVASFDHGTRRVESGVLHRDLGTDDHNCPALLMGDDGHVTAFYPAHPRGAHLFYRRTTEPEDVRSWGSSGGCPSTRRAPRATPTPTR